MFQHAQDSLKCYYDQKITSFFPSDFKSVFVWHLTPQNLRLRIFKCKFRISRSTIFHIQNYNKASSTVAHTGKTQLNSCSETQQSFEEHNNLLDNATIFFRTQQFFREHNNLLENTTIFSRIQQSIREHNSLSRTQGIFLMHNNLFQNTITFSDTQTQTKTQQN